MASRIALVVLLLSILAVEARAGIGIWTRDLSQAEHADVPEGAPSGVMVGAAYPGSPAAKAGILAGDRIIGVNGRRITSDAAFSRVLGLIGTGAPVRLEIQRRHDSLELDVLRVDELEYLGEACESGEGLACRDLAGAYRSGDGVPADPKKAAALLRKGCRLGAAPACRTLALRLARGQEGSTTPADAVALMRWSCRNGDGVACWTMAEYHAGGHFGLQKSRPRRRAYHELGCEAGNRHSCNELGKALEDGDGGSEDATRAAVAYESGCARDLMESCVWLGWLLVKGKGVSPDREKGRELFERSCAAGLSRGCTAHAEVLLKRGEGQPALAILAKTCEQDHQEACCLMAQVHEKGLGGVRANVAAAAKLYDELCRNGHAHACHDLAFLYSAGPGYTAGNGLEKDESRSLQLYEKACALDYVESCGQAGRLHTQREGGPRDLERGRALLQKACDAGLPDPCGWLRDLAEQDEQRRLEPIWARRRARGEMAPGRMRYSGETRTQGQVSPAALITTVWDAGEEWIIEEDWTLGGGSMTEISSLEKETLFLRRHASRAGEFAIRELEVQDGWVVGWNAVPDSPDPRHEIVIDAPDPILAWGAGAPQVLATLPLARGYEASLWGIQLGARSVTPRKLEVVAVGTIRVPAGTFTAWKVVVREAEPGGHVLTFWIDTQSRRVVRYDGGTRGPGAWWTLTLEP